VSSSDQRSNPEAGARRGPGEQRMSALGTRRFHRGTQGERRHGETRRTANPRTLNLDSRGFGSGRFLVVWCALLLQIRFPDSQPSLDSDFLICRLAVQQEAVSPVTDMLAHRGRSFPLAIGKSLLFIAACSRENKARLPLTLTGPYRLRKNESIANDVRVVTIFEEPKTLRTTYPKVPNGCSKL